ncbi:MAG: PrpR N-terminal domain-containing protein [Planctomycetes bacterium]|nr:PrpR N-terminal domain-containing protein [Planctomycetota bacterium]
MLQIAFMVPVESLTDRVAAVSAEHARRDNGNDSDEFVVTINVAKNYRSIPRVALNADVLVARGLLAAQLKQIHPNLPLVEVAIGSDMAATIFTAVKERGPLPIAVIGSANMAYAVHGMGTILGVDIKEYIQDNNEDFSIKRDIDRILAEGRKILICGPVTYAYAVTRDCYPYLLELHKHSIWDALTRAKQEARARRKEREKAVQFQAVLNAAHEGIIVTDTSGRVTIINAVAAEILAISSAKAIGGRVYDILPMAGLPASVLSADHIDACVVLKGARLYVRKSPVMLGDQSQGHVFALAIDVFNPAE